MVSNAGDGYENPYQIVLHDHKESHQYTQITTERNTRSSSVDPIFGMPTLEKSLKKEEELSFIGQTDIQTIVGQEGKEMTITCFSDTDKYITALRLELNGTAVALGDNQTVDFKFKPDRKDHLSRYKCEDVIQSSITIEVKLIVTYHSDQIDDELSSISFPATNVSSSDTNTDYDQNLTLTRPSNISVGVNHQSTDESESFATSELPSNFQSTDAQEQRPCPVLQMQKFAIRSMRISFSNALSNTNSETSMESDSESSDNVMVGSDGDGYENPYETISQEREESHQYIMMSKERHNSFSSIEYHCKDDRLETTNAKEATYINLQF
ncbi:unnamed protein product [Mytilus edulis]|uniref:Uncharacterized protein n=1 Tax=Mytilus edulis TaxID=6550 RepID=A0A8S3VHK1_MYTED|nr:unnamed protein product [Mytilus edulis]